MKKLLLSIPLILSFELRAEILVDSVHSFSEGKQDEEHLLHLNSGRVVFVDQSYTSEDFTPGEAVEIEINTKNQLEAATLLDSRQQNFSGEFTDKRSMQDKATVLPNLSRAITIFNGMNRSYKNKSECTDRAHIWAYEEWRKHGLVSQKMFMFFTNTYIRKYNYHWWFHATPYVLVGSGNTEYMMDRRYTSGPRLRKTWSDIFIRSKRSCPITTYSHYRRNKNGVEHCFHVKSNMYNRLPYHVRMQEDYGRVQTRFSNSEVNFSYRAFTRRGPIQ